MWIIPILLIGAIVVAASSKSPREAASPARQLPPPNVAGLPGPISVLGEVLRVGQHPSPTVILCAIAEAEAIGRSDLASDIVRAFVAPVVYAHQRMLGARPVAHERGSCQLAPAPRASADHQRGSCAPARSPREAAPLHAVVAPLAPPPGAPALAPQQPTEEKILSMLHADPQAFLSMVSSRRPAVIDVPNEAPMPMPVAPPAAPPPVAPATVSAPHASAALTQPTGLPPEVVAQMQEAAGLHGAADQTRALAPGSPLGGIPDDAWREFVTRLEREAPTFSSSRHVGQYRQRRERLAELGIDPTAIHGSAAAQRAALDVDLADAHGHAAAGDLISEHLGRLFALPGRDGAEMVTLSGLLGVIQCAGLEGAVGWLERSNDRKRYPHTTRAFLRTNGIF
jgi:hypothetical protein